MPATGTEQERFLNPPAECPVDLREVNEALETKLRAVEAQLARATAKWEGPPRPAPAEDWPVIVSRHPAAVEFIQGWRAESGAGDGVFSPPAKVLAQAGPEDVQGRVVYGNLPMALAALAREVNAVEFTGTPPRGAEYGVQEMQAAGAHLRRYRVLAL